MVPYQFRRLFEELLALPSGRALLILDLLDELERDVYQVVRNEFVESWLNDPIFELPATPYQICWQKDGFSFFRDHKNSTFDVLTTLVANLKLTYYEQLEFRVLFLYRSGLLFEAPTCTLEQHFNELIKLLDKLSPSSSPLK